jgi:protein-S-isoprenylcysteine O-methyltransferase Ste14
MKEHIAHTGAWGLALIVIQGIVHWPTVFSVALFPVIVFVYALLARSEERKMVNQFGEEYRAYQRRVPMFIPRHGHWRDMTRLQNNEGI